MTLASIEDSIAIGAECAWQERDFPKTTWGMLERCATNSPANPAVSFQMFSGPTDKTETLSWAELRDQVSQAANLLRELGIGEDDTVAYLLPNCTEAVVCYLAGQVAGKVNPLNPLLDAETIGGLLRETNAKVLVTLRAFPKTDVAEKAAEALHYAPGVETVLEVDLLRYMTGIKRLIVPLIRPRVEVRHRARVLSFGAEMASRPKTLSFPDATSDRAAALFHTGGTTGLPKVAQHRFSGIAYNAWLGDRLLFDADDVLMCPLPMFHVFAAIVAMGSALGSGAHIVFITPQGYRGEGVYKNFWKLCERYKASFIITVPTAMSRLMQVPVDADISKLRLAFCGSAPLSLDLYKSFEKMAGVTICEGYGLTEATCLVSINPPDGEKRVGSIGVPFPHTDIKIANLATGAECAVDEVGEICVDSPGIWGGNVYLEASKNDDMFRPGARSDVQYLRTGDLGRIDAEGYVWITGRAKDIIIRGGHNIDPDEIEEALATHPAVAMAAAIGQPDAHSGEVPCAFVELLDGKSATPAELIVWAEERVNERAAHPKHIEILPELPKTAVGKILKNELRKRAIKRVYDAALVNADVAADVVEVIEDRKRGLVAQLRPSGTATDDEVQAAIGAFTRPWAWAPGSHHPSDDPSDSE